MNIYAPIPYIKQPKEMFIVENPVNEELIELNNLFKCDSMYNHWTENGGKPIAGSSPILYARKTVVEMLEKAEALLPEGYRFKILDAYRPVKVQQALWDFYREKIADENPDKSSEQIDNMAVNYVSYPSYDEKQPSLHNTGGAIDVTVEDLSGIQLNMGCEFDDFSMKATTNFFENNTDLFSEEIRNNRRILYNVMTEVGFTNLPSEWWHYDYGDNAWAVLSRKKPIYDGILDFRRRG